MMLGGLVIGVWGGFKNRSYTMALATICFGLGTIGLGLLNNFWPYLACMAFVGITMPTFNAPMMAIMQEKIDPNFMGRVFSVFMMLGSLAMPLGMLVFGPLADWLAIDWLLIGTGGGIALLSGYLVYNRELRKAGIPSSPPDSPDAISEV
jgi:DHA3 family macrolide efflux protein-like MFS transporter